MAMLVFAWFNFVLYPAILQYQAGTQAGKYISHLPSTQPAAGTSDANGIRARATTDSVYLLQEGGDCYSFEFDCPRPVGRIPIDSLTPVINHRPTLVFAPARFADSFTARQLHARPIREFSNFHISQLTGPFIDYRTRNEVLTPWWLMEVAH
jgi:hypothetical protein